MAGQDSYRSYSLRNTPAQDYRKIPHFQRRISDRQNFSFAKRQENFLGKSALCPISCEGLFPKVSKRRLFGQSPNPAIPLNHNILYFSIDTCLSIEYTPKPLRGRNTIKFQAERCGKLCPDAIMLFDKWPGFVRRIDRWWIVRYSLASAQSRPGRNAGRA